MRPGGAANLDVVTHGLEGWVNGSDPSLGRFVGNLFCGTHASYLDLPHITAKGTYPTEVGIDGLPVVDGELDNTFKPRQTTSDVDLK